MLMVPLPPHTSQLVYPWTPNFTNLLQILFSSLFSLLNQTPANASLHARESHKQLYNALALVILYFPACTHRLCYFINTSSNYAHLLREHEFLTTLHHAAIEPHHFGTTFLPSPCCCTPQRLWPFYPPLTLKKKNHRHRFSFLNQNTAQFLAPSRCTRKFLTYTLKVSGQLFFCSLHCCFFFLDAKKSVSL